MRIIKTPKLHFYDTGLLYYLLNIQKPDQLRLDAFERQLFGQEAFRYRMQKVCFTRF